MAHRCGGYLQSLAEGHKTLLLLIPQRQRHRAQAAADSQMGHALEQGVLIVAFLQVIVGNARAEVVDVMKADVARKPL